VPNRTITTIAGTQKRSRVLAGTIGVFSSALCVGASVRWAFKTSSVFSDSLWTNHRNPTPPQFPARNGCFEVLSTRWGSQLPDSSQIAVSHKWANAQGVRCFDQAVLGPRPLYELVPQAGGGAGVQVEPSPQLRQLRHEPYPARRGSIRCLHFGRRFYGCCGQSASGPSERPTVRSTECRARRRSTTSTALPARPWRSKPPCSPRFPPIARHHIQRAG